jgi:hypothetical protein
MSPYVMMFYPSFFHPHAIDIMPPIVALEAGLLV